LEAVLSRVRTGVARPVGLAAGGCVNVLMSMYVCMRVCSKYSALRCPPPVEPVPPRKLRQVEEGSVFRQLEQLQHATVSNPREGARK